MKEGINLNVSESDYHGFPAVSKSKLWAFAKNPRKWNETKDVPFPTTASMTWGSLVDCLVLQPHELSECFAASPYKDFKTKEAQAWRDSQPVPIVTQSQVEEATKAADRIRSHHFAAPVLDGATCQVSALAAGIESNTGERFLAKCRIDILPARDGDFGDWVFDLKTTATIGRLENVISDFAYHVQASFYLDIFNTASGEDRTRWGFIFQESEFPYEIAVVELDKEAISWGREWYLSALEKWCFSHKTGIFPNPFDDEIRVVGLPRWAKRGAE